jgi:hypothetical protein
VVLAAQPATPVQLAHACLAAGFDHVIPASWGDELVAERTVERLRDCEMPVLQCSCPHVMQRLAATADVLAPMIVRVVPPVVALARHLRSASPLVRATVTYAGGCPAAADSAIDVWMSPEELLTSLDRRGISPAAQPTVFDSVLPPDRRRHWSEPGGIPAAGAMRSIGGGVREIVTGDFVPEVADLLLSRQRVLVDVALAAGCVCSGVRKGDDAMAARARVTALEPPRSGTPVIDRAASLSLDGEVSPRTDTAPPVPPAASVTHASQVRRDSPPGELAAVAAPTPLAAPSRRTPSGGAKAVLGSMPLTRRESGRQLPRAYIARRRSSPRGLRAEPASQIRDAEPKPAPNRRVLVWAVAIGVGAGLALAALLRFLF